MAQEPGMMKKNIIRIRVLSMTVMGAVDALKLKRNGMHIWKPVHMVAWRLKYLQTSLADSIFFRQTQKVMRR